MMGEQTVSVIIPTHNRSASLRRALDALRVQTYPLRQVEVVVVADGCTDETVEILHHYDAPFALRVTEQSSQGVSAARNRGASCATGWLLIFLDDDVEPTPALIEAHVRAHQLLPGHVAIGPYPPVPQAQINFFHNKLRASWEAIFHPMLQVGHRYTYSDLLGGNLSLEAELFARVGGFDNCFVAHEDSELGVRLIKAGVPFTFAADALGYHHDTSDPDRSFLRKRQEGRADVILARRHPELIQVLPLAGFKARCSSLRRILRILAFSCPTAGDLLAACLRRELDLVERARLRRRWRRLLEDVQDFWYWRGVAEELGTRRALANLGQGRQARYDECGPKIELDLHEGLEAAERLLDEERPPGALICYGPQPVGFIPPKPGAERLRGAHLRPILATDLAVSLLQALVLEGAITAPTAADRLKLSKSIEVQAARARGLGPVDLGLDQYSDWQRLDGHQAENGRVFWEQQGRIKDLGHKKAWLEEQRDNWWRLAEERERMIREQQAWIEELGRDKATLDEERQHWQRLAGEYRGKPNGQQS